MFLLVAVLATQAFAPAAQAVPCWEENGPPSFPSDVVVVGPGQITVNTDKAVGYAQAMVTWSRTGAPQMLADCGVDADAIVAMVNKLRSCVQAKATVIVQGTPGRYVVVNGINVQVNYGVLLNDLAAVAQCVVTT